MTLPSWVPEIEDKPAPMPLLLVQAFVNTVDTDLGTDRLARDDDARSWLAQAGLLDPAVTPAAADYQLSRQVRESIRHLIGGEPLTAAHSEPLDVLLTRAEAPLTITADGQVQLCAEPADTIPNGLAKLLLIIRDAQSDGTWARLRLCANPDCGWAFYDRSHARRGQWCSMTTCGNRIKNRNLRARQRG
jgi:predicted RNA-binding Zn ribbon-like protein